MVTRNFKNMLTMALTASATQYAGCQVIDVDGRSWFLNRKFTSFPYSITASLTTTANAAGISIAAGDPQDASKNDDRANNLLNTITSGVTLTLVSTTSGTDSFGAPYVEYKITITNTGSEALTIREVGYKQKLRCMKYVGDSGDSEVVFLLDRTVLETPLVIQPGDAGVLHYRLAVFADREKAGVKLVSFSFGTDEEIAAMIDAARNGTIDLQTDGGWQVGDMRRIHLDAWTGGNNVSHAATDLDIVIAEFGDYNSCGCLFQFEFFEFVTETQRMASSNTNVGGYSATEMYTTTLPAMVEALPEWLKSRMKTFSVLVGAGNGSSEIETVGNNKLALRSEAEVFGTSEHSAPGEGTETARNKLGKKTSNKYKGGSFSGGAGLNWWLRSPSIGSTEKFVRATWGTATGDPAYAFPADYNASGTYGVSPFGCI